MQGMCRLCLNEGDLKESHFIPKFIGKWMKATSATGYLRDASDIDKRIQDIAKDYWMCGACETLFSRWERDFASKVFYPYQKDSASSYRYGEWMAKFCASLSWRSLSYMRHTNPGDQRLENIKDDLDGADLALRNFLLGMSSNPGQYEQHLYPLEAAARVPVQGASARINRYFLRTVYMDIVSSEGSVFVFTKLPAFILLGVVKCPEVKKMRSSRIAISSGVISPRAYVIPSGLWGYMNEKAEKSGQQYSEMSEAQQKKINDFILKNPEKVANSETIKAFLHDFEMFGSEVFEGKIPGENL
ncbi:hypothetical protein [Pseudomonas tussilaginis]|uniref:hypothetical protein n=1 Tax=Pseudomonas putida TaxID=303 RepID=UPI0023633C02|nr:hypothetical protein [Pseudomonas putida]MDD1976967.1 hypothetical protein [Pseudomonas putida]